ncbi:hypothetical protein CC80DRAFT_494984 [Byssothecium circinans]|uniref:Uncharacterized protein n=1 Tax=Byssothecium circinans TaxID=147558 RepID=A0A6A5TPU6_9PLEO|nr:hypothetical protein CC80DRAFT_494984 [Byssothecium circinans]
MPPSRNTEDLNSLFSALSLPEALFTLPANPRGFNLEVIKSLQFDEPVIPKSTLYYLLDHIFEGNLPHSGTKSTRPLIREDEVPLQVKPYSEWALAPFSHRSSCLQERLLNMPEDFHVPISSEFSALRARIWLGLVPMSGARWKQKKLDDWQNWQFLFEYLFQVLRVFIWMGDPAIQRAIQGHFNHVAAELEFFQNAINTRREQLGTVSERVDLKNLWLEFITSTFETMVTRTHTWFHDRIHETIAQAQTWYNTQVEEHGAENSYQAAVKFGECFSDLSRMLTLADFSMMMPLDGFTGFAASPSDSKVVGSMFPLPFRRDQIHDMEEAMSWPAAESSVDDIEGMQRSPERFRAVINESIVKHEEIRKQMRGEPIVLGREHWITIIHSRTKWSLDHGGPQDQRWGFVAYMLTHTPTDEQWTAFLAKLYADFAQSGEWVQGFDEVKERKDLQWIDGKRSGIPHDDIEAARRHFLRFRNSPSMRRRNWTQDFLVIDTESFSSYMNPFPPSLPATPPAPGTITVPAQGDFAGFVKVIDTSPYRPHVLAQQAPGYRNELKVLGTLVFDELYPLLASLTLRPRDLWMMACWHPMQVYVGLATASQEKGWRGVWEAREVMFGAFARLVARQRSSGDIRSR